MVQMFVELKFSFRKCCKTKPQIILMMHVNEIWYVPILKNYFMSFNLGPSRMSHEGSSLKTNRHIKKQLFNFIKLIKTLHKYFIIVI